VKNLGRAVLIAALIAINVYTLPAFAAYNTGSAQFGGSGQYLSVAASSDLLLAPETSLLNGGNI